MDLERNQLGLIGTPGLLLIDMIEGFTDPACPLGSESDRAVAAASQLLALFRQQQWPVFFTTVLYRDPSQARVFRQRVPALNVLTPDSRWVQVDSRLAPAKGEQVIEKQWASGFFKTDLAEQLDIAGVKSLVLVGLTTSGCVRATAVDALQHEYPTVVVEDAVGDRNLQAHRANLFDMHAKYVDVQSLEITLAELRQLAAAHILIPEQA